MRIVVKNLQKKIKINPVKIKQIARRINCPAKGPLRPRSEASEARQRRPAKFDNLELGLYFVKDSVIKRLNKQFFNKDCLTDVISFNLEKNYAEVFIAPNVASKNAVKFGAGQKEELYRCIVHGILHILGYRDGSKKEKTRMWKKQEDILSRIIQR